MSSSAAPRVLAPGRLNGQTALVTGAGTGIGRGVARRLAELGAAVVGVGRRPEPLAETTRMVEQDGGPGTFRAHPLDIRDRSAAAALVAEVADGGRLDVLVNNAGGQFVAPALELSDRGMAAVLDLNLTATAHLTTAAAPCLAAAHGTVVTITLSAAHRGIPGLAHSATARAAMIALTAQLAADWERDNIRMYCLAPGTVLTDGVRAELTPDALQRALRGTPLRSDTTVAEIAEWVAALAAGIGPASGAVIELDGGAGIHGVGAILATDDVDAGVGGRSGDGALR